MFFFSLFSFSQQDDVIKVEIKLVFNDKPIVAGNSYISNKKDTLTFETIRFYLSSFELTYKENKTHKETNSYYLIDFEKPESLQFELKCSSVEEIKQLKFNIGVDSLASVSGAMEGDLDATKGMYWSWQSGFINTKIEGISKSCKTRKNKFQFHVGGYLEPFYAMKKININCNAKNQFQKVHHSSLVLEGLGENKIIIKVDLAILFDEVELSKTNTIMIPGKEAMKIADLTTKMFSIE
jgi:hypothetical protein